MLSALLRALMRLLAYLLTGVRALADTPWPTTPTVYFANHVSHFDFVLLWTALPRAQRTLAKPVAAADYWGRHWLLRLFSTQVLRALLIEREKSARTVDPIEQMAAVLGAGGQLILFPEGTRNRNDQLLPFKSGLYHLAQRCPNAVLMPTHIDNLHRVLPKGELLPIPLLCTVRFGAPLQRVSGEPKEAFLARARAAVIALADGKTDA